MGAYNPEYPRKVPVFRVYDREKSVVARRRARAPRARRTKTIVRKRKAAQTEGADASKFHR